MFKDIDLMCDGKLKEKVYDRVFNFASQKDLSE